MKRSLPTISVCLIAFALACEKRPGGTSAPGGSPGAGSGSPIGGGEAEDGAEGAAAPAGDEDAEEGVEGSAPMDDRARVPVVASDDPMHARLEGDGFANDCKADTDCKVGGCSGEICSADPGVSSTCEAFPRRLPDDATCGCVTAQCQWWSPSGAAMKPAPSVQRPQSNAGEAKDGTCDGKTCKPGQECVRYFGIAGPSGPAFSSCEWRCKAGAKDVCPKGTKCVTIADGPGSVCR